MDFPVFDLHCDTALALLGRGVNEVGDLKSNTGHVDLDRAAALPGYAQCFACFTTPAMEQWYKKSPVEIFERELATILSQMEKHPGKIRQAYSAADVRKNAEAGRMSGILTIEGPAGFGFDPALLEDLYAVGFRMTTLGWNENNVLAGSHVTGGGLTDLGKEYLKEAQRLGLIVDVSHVSDEAFWDMMKITEKPIIASHSNSRAVCDVSRNLTDDMFRAIMETGGVAGLNLYTDFIGENADLDRACDHILHWLELDPDGNHIALGGDLDGCEALPAGFEGVQSYPALAKQLALRGVDDQLLRKIFWENALGVMETCCM